MLPTTFVEEVLVKFDLVKVSALGLVLALGGCPPAAEVVDAGSDVGIDATAADHDAFVLADEDAPVGDDAPVDIDAAPDAFVPRDAWVGPDAYVDMDGDGVNDSVDCNPMDRTLAATATRSCETGCGLGTQSCTGGVWTECGGLECTCPTEGRTRAANCGTCGRMLQTCTGGRWVGSTCEGERGNCVAGASRSGAYINCAVARYVCSSTCWWERGEILEPVGECAAGTRRCGDGQDSLCTDDCRLVDNPDCMLK